MKKWDLLVFYFRIILVSLLFSNAISFAQITNVSNSKELIAILEQDKNFGQIYLSNGVYQIDAINVKAGGEIRPIAGANPIIVGKYSIVENHNDFDDGGMYWKKRLNDFHRCDFFLLDEYFNAIPISGVELGLRNIEYVEHEIKKIDDKERKIAIPIISDYGFMRNRSKVFFKYCILKLSCCFICMDVVDLYSDDNYVYGIVDSEYHYSLLGKHRNMYSYATFFNYPIFDGSAAFVDSQDYLYIPTKYKKAYLSTSTNILNLQGNRALTIESVKFTASTVPINLGNNTSNKIIKDCVFENCGTGVEFNNHVINANGNLIISGCVFTNMYSNYVVRIQPVNNVSILNNRFSHTGILNKGGSVIGVNGDNFLVEGNVIVDFSYQGISCGINEQYNNNRVKGVIRNNVVDNIARYGDASTQLYDGGGIYAYEHVDLLTIENNIIRNFGFDNGLRFGLYLDGGAYNVIARNNLIYNIYPGQAAVHARFVITSPTFRTNNVFQDNVIIGDCVFGGNKDGECRTLVQNNFISGEIKLNNEFVDQRGNKIIKARTDGNMVYIDRRSGLNRWNYPKEIRTVLKKATVE